MIFSNDQLGIADCLKIKIFDACILASEFPECSGHCYSGRVARQAALLTPAPPPVLPSHSVSTSSSVQPAAATTVATPGAELKRDLDLINFVKVHLS